MASVDVLKGVMKWLNRAEWQQPLDELIERHFGPACEEAGITLDELTDTIGDQADSVLWACVIEDFLASDLDNRRNIVDDYLKRRGWRESVPNKRYLASLRSSVMSLYEVSDIVRDQSFLARDLLRGGEPVRISEKSATHSLTQWDRLAARVVKVGPRFEMAGGALVFSHELSEAAREDFAALRKKMHAEAAKLFGQGPDDREVDQFTLDTEILRYSAFLFTRIWLDDVLGQVVDPRSPTLRNSDGDEIAFTTVRYPLKETCDRKALEGALTTLPDFRRAGDNLWNWSAGAAPATGKAPEGDQTLVSTFSDGSVSMGYVELEAEALKLEANSPQRAQRARALLDPVIGPFVGPPVVESKTAAEIMASPPPDEDQAPSSGLSPDEERAIMHETLERHYRGLLDLPVPVLGNVSPREATKTEEGRERLVAWLKFLENATALQDADSPMTGYDVSWMWAELGVAELRR